MNHEKCLCGHSKGKHYYGLHSCSASIVNPCGCMEFVQRDAAKDCADALLPMARAAVNVKRAILEGGTE